MEGVDYSFGRPDPGGLYKAGKRFAARYVGTQGSGKNLTKTETDALRRAGLAVVATYETSAGFMITADGAAAARRAREDAVACGMPASRPIYFALDVDPRSLTATQWLGVERFLGAAAAAIGRGAVGVYGGYMAIERLVPRFAAWGWQTYGWSGGQWSTKAHFRQYRNGVSLAGATVDLCRSVTADFGQWGIGPVPEEEDMPLDPADLDAIGNRVRAVLNEGTGTGQATWAGTCKATLHTVQQNFNKLNALAIAVAALNTDDLDEVQLAALLADHLDDNLAAAVSDAIVAKLPDTAITKQDVASAVRETFAAAFTVPSTG